MPCTCRAGCRRRTVCSRSTSCAARRAAHWRSSQVPAPCPAISSCARSAWPARPSARSPRCRRRRGLACRPMPMASMPGLRATRCPCSTARSRSRSSSRGHRSTARSSARRSRSASRSTSTRVRPRTTRRMSRSSGRNWRRRCSSVMSSVRRRSTRPPASRTQRMRRRSWGRSRPAQRPLPRSRRRLPPPDCRRPRRRLTLRSSRACATCGDATSPCRSSRTPWHAPSSRSAPTNGPWRVHIRAMGGRWWRMTRTSGSTCRRRSTRCTWSAGRTASMPSAAASRARRGWCSARTVASPGARPPAAST